MIRNIINTPMLKCLAVSMSISGLMLSAGCTGTLSNNINDDGQVAVSDLIFPEQDKAWQKDGQFPNSENLSKVRAGVSKDDLYQLIGRPHFSEAHNAREWDYIFKFYQADGSVQTCQYKVIFDKAFKAQQFYWQPSECAKYAEVHAPEQPIFNEKINLAADTLFDFDKWQAKDMMPAGQRSLDDLATVLRRYQDQGNSHVVVTGYTDHLGDEAYNLMLSKQRAQTVRQYLIAQGVDANTITAAGGGESALLTQCSDAMERQERIKCLQPNRRVEVAVTVYKVQ